MSYADDALIDMAGLLFSGVVRQWNPNLNDAAMAAFVDELRRALADALTVRKGGEFLPDDALDPERIAALLWAMDAGGWSRLTSYQLADHETKEYWRTLAQEFLDALTVRKGAG